MKRQFLCILVASAMISAACTVDVDMYDDLVGSDIWTKKADFPGTHRSCAVSFSIGNKGYFGTGGSVSNSDDFWEYNPASNVWTQKANFAGGERDEAFGFSIGDKGYLGGGLRWSGGSGSIIYYNDFWEYDLASNKWTRKADFPSTRTTELAGFSIDTKGYCGPDYSGELCEYNPASNTWKKTAKILWVEYGCNYYGFSIGNKGYVGSACFDNQGFWEYHPVSNTWTQRANMPSSGDGYRAGAGVFSIGNKGYFGMGYGDGYNQDFWEYDPVSNIWSRKADFAGGDSYISTGFTVGNKGYVVRSHGSGKGGSESLWEFTP